jgi:hypothetical protein
LAQLSHVAVRKLTQPTDQNLPKLQGCRNTISKSTIRVHSVDLTQLIGLVESLLDSIYSNAVTSQNSSANAAL